MQTFKLVVGPDGRMKIPGTQPGQVVTIQVELDSVERPLRSPEERERIIQEQLEESRQARASMSPKDLERALNHGDWLYDPNGLPR